jgi:hypothetical protein
MGSSAGLNEYEEVKRVLLLSGIGRRPSARSLSLYHLSYQDSQKENSY